MSYVEFITKRATTGTSIDFNLLPFTVGSDNVIEFDLASADYGSEVTRDVSVSLGGFRETVFHRTQQTYSLTTTWMNEQEFTNFRCFLHSVMSGESFAISIYGQAADADGVTAYLSGDFGVSRNSVMRQYKINFSIILGEVLV